MITKDFVFRARKNWLEASVDLNFELITPYLVEIGGKIKDLFAYLPQYGSPNGMIVVLTTCPDYRIDESIVKFAKEHEYFYSFIEVSDFLEYNRDHCCPEKFYHKVSCTTEPVSGTLTGTVG